MRSVSRDLIMHRPIAFASCLYLVFIVSVMLSDDVCSRGAGKTPIVRSEYSCGFERQRKKSHGAGGVADSWPNSYINNKNNAIINITM